MGLSKAILIGNVGRDVEMKEAKSGTKIAKFSFATTDHRYKDQDGKPLTEWHNIVAFGKTAEFAGAHVRKGTSLYIEGRIHHDVYEKDGQKKYYTEIIADQLQFVGPKPDHDYDNDDGGF